MEVCAQIVMASVSHDECHLDSIGDAADADISQAQDAADVESC